MIRSLPHASPSVSPSPSVSLLVPSLLASSLLASSLLGGCGGGTSSGGTSPGEPEPVFADPGGAAPSSGDPYGAGATPALPAPLLVIKADPERSASVPDIVDVETLADSGLQVAYTDPVQRARVDPLRVGAQWQHMQSCVSIVAAPPLVLIRTDVEPFAVTDDVIRDFEGRISASASSLVDGVAILQVRDAAFDGTHADAGFGLLRQIMGRHLWLSAGLLERFYPSECARETPPDAVSGTAPDPLSTEI